MSKPPRFPYSWSPQITEAVPIGWLAQACRRIQFPLDSSESSFWPAFDYAWRAYNNLYNKVSDNRRGDRARMRTAIAQDGSTLLSMIKNLIRPQGVASLQVDEDGEQLERSDEIRHLYALYRAIVSHKSVTTEDVMEVFYDARCGRFHGDDDYGSTPSPRGMEERAALARQLVKWMTEVLIAVDKFFLMKLHRELTEEKIDGYVDSRLFQLLDEIRSAAGKLPVL